MTLATNNQFFYTLYLTIPHLIGMLMGQKYLTGAGQWRLSPEHEARPSLVLSGIHMHYGDGSCLIQMQREQEQDLEWKGE